MSESPVLAAFNDGHRLLGEFISDAKNIELVEKFAEDLAACFNKGGKVIIFGNGGSACDAAHFAEEFTGRYRGSRRSLPVMALNDPGHITCVGNDYGFEEIFRRPVEAFCKPEDVVIGLSTSGNSENVKRALDEAKSKGAQTVALLGKTGGVMKGEYDYEWIAPGQNSDRIQEIHMMLLHIVIEGVERLLFPENY